MSLKPPLNRVSDFDIRLLRVFKTVVEAGSFSAAESSLGISRSAISLHMGDLEKRIGLRLCQRGRAGFALTDEGREVLRAIEALLASIESFRSEVNEMHRQLRGDLNIGVVNNLVTLPRIRITQALKAVRAESAGVRINISMSTPSDIERGVLDGRLHVGAVPLITPLSGLEYKPLYEERSYLYCSNEHPLFDRAGSVTDEQLQCADAVVPSYRMTAEAVALHQLLNSAATATDREGSAFLILTGSFIGFLPDHYAAKWVSKGLMAPLNPERFWFETTIASVTRKGRRPHLILQRFLDSLDQTQ